MIGWVIFSFVFISIRATNEVRPCIDKATNCAEPLIQGYCKSETMIKNMAEVCAKSCGFCQDSNEEGPESRQHQGPCTPHAILVDPDCVERENCKQLCKGTCDTNHNCVCELGYRDKWCEKFTGRDYFEYENNFRFRQCEKGAEGVSIEILIGISNPNELECKAACDEARKKCNAVNYSVEKQICQLLFCAENPPYPTGTREGFYGYSVKKIPEPNTKFGIVFPDEQKAVNLKSRVELSCGWSFSVVDPTSFPKCTWITPQKINLKMEDIEGRKIAGIKTPFFDKHEGQCSILIEEVKFADIGSWQCNVFLPGKTERRTLRILVDENDPSVNYTFRETPYKTDGKMQCITLKQLSDFTKIKKKAPLQFCMEQCDDDSICNAFNWSPNTPSCDLLSCASPLPPPRGRKKNVFAYLHKSLEVHGKSPSRNKYKCQNGMWIDELWLCDGENDCIDFSDEGIAGCHDQPQLQKRIKIAFPEKWKQEGIHIGNRVHLSCGWSPKGYKPNENACTWTTPDKVELQMLDIYNYSIENIAPRTLLTSTFDQCGIDIISFESRNIGSWECKVHHLSENNTGTVRVTTDDDDPSASYLFREKYYIGGVCSTVELFPIKSFNVEECMAECDKKEDFGCNAFNWYPKNPSCTLLYCNIPLLEPEGTEEREKNVHAVLNKKVFESKCHDLYQLGTCERDISHCQIGYSKYKNFIRNCRKTCGLCTDPTTTIAPVTCATNEFTCSSGQCIGEDLHCNGEPDCIDKSDELNCPAYEVCPSQICSDDPDGQHIFSYGTCRSSCLYNELEVRKCTKKGGSPDAQPCRCCAKYNVQAHCNYFNLTTEECEDIYGNDLKKVQTTPSIPEAEAEWRSSGDHKRHCSLGEKQGDNFGCNDIQPSILNDYNCTLKTFLKKLDWFCIRCQVKALDGLEAGEGCRENCFNSGTTHNCFDVLDWYNFEWGAVRKETFKCMAFYLSLRKPPALLADPLCRRAVIRCNRDDYKC